MRPADGDMVMLDTALRWQASYCGRAGAPTAVAMIDAVAADVARGGPLAVLLPATVRFGDLLGLRVMAAVNRLAIEGRAPDVATALATLGGVPPRDERQLADFRAAVVEALAAHPAVLAVSLASTPQTNETGRAALLRGAMSRLDPALGLRLVEVGTSAGLNLRADHLPGLAALEAGPLPQVVERVGGDLHPIDPSTSQGRTTLTSYIWGDDVLRYERLLRALDVAAAVPAEVRRVEGADLVESLGLVPGTTTLLWHSATWVYLPHRTRSRILAAVRSLGSQASPQQVFAYATWEWDGDDPDPAEPFALVLRLWSGGADDGRPFELARGSSHGTVTTVHPGVGSPLDAEPLPR